MALVMLPSDLPWWSNVEKHLISIQKAENINVILESMQKIHDLCNVSLDPDDDKADSTFLDGLKKLIKQDYSTEENSQLIDIIKIIAKHAQSIKTLRPPRGLSFSLQQQADTIEVNRFFAAALLANAFFSTFSKRTEKTHPTLQDFNFTNFFRSLDSNSQKAKLVCLLHYFKWIDERKTFQDSIKVSRKVMPGKQWLTIEDWMECTFPLCSIEVKHQGRIENHSNNTIQSVFASSRIGGRALRSGNSQECLQFFTSPESLACMLFVEALEDNEALLIQGVHQLAVVMDPKNKASIEFLQEVRQVSLCCYDAENYRVLPVNQFEEDNILRELNKCLLAFRQNSTCKIIESNQKKSRKGNNTRLSPIGESGSNSPSDVTTKIIINQPSTASNQSLSETRNEETDVNKNKQWLAPYPKTTKGPVLSNATGVERRGRFIVLGSSGERLPVNRRSLSGRDSSNMFSSCDSDEEFHSAKDSFDDSDDDLLEKLNSKELDTPEKRKTFVRKLQAALKESSNYTESTASSCDVGGSFSPSQDEDALRLRRDGSTGFVLTEDCLDEQFYKNSLQHEQQWLDKFRSKQAAIQRKDTNDSSKYSFSTDLNSELDEVFERFSKWLDDPELIEQGHKLDPRNEAVQNFANSLLKRTLSESFVGIPLTDGCVTSIVSFIEDALIEEYKNNKTTPQLNTKSLSLELAKFKYQLKDQVMSQLNKKRNTIGNSLPIATGNWGCGSSKMGEVQLKMVIQWMAASAADLPYLLYYTSGNSNLNKLDTLIRVLRDRQWTVGQLAKASLDYAKEKIENTTELTKNSRDFFERLIGI